MTDGSGSEAVPPVIVSSIDDVFVGRDREVAAVLNAVLTAVNDDGRVVVIRGEAGIGKSTLLAHAATILRERHWRVVHVRSDELELDAAVPYANLARAVRPDVLGLTGEVARLAIEFLATTDAQAQHPVGAVRAAAGRLLAALRDEAPIALLIDDLHLLDEDSVALLAGLTRRQGRRPLVLVGAVRWPAVEWDGALGLFLGRLTHDQRLWPIHVAPLDSRATAQLVSAALTRPPDARLVDLVQRQSDGNPFLAVQALLDLAAVGAIVPDTAGWRLAGESAPWSAERRQLVLQRVLRVGPEAQRLGSALALLGSVALTHLGIAAQMAGLSMSEAAAAFDSLVAQRILRGHEDGEYRFSHGLLRDALYADIERDERDAWHRVAVVELSRLRSSPAVDLEVAAHVWATAETGDEDAIAALGRAAERACTTTPHSSIPWFDRALAITPVGHPARAELMSRRARALFLAGKARDAATTGREALAELRDPTRRARLASLVIDALTEVAAVEEAACLLEDERADAYSDLRLASQAAYVFGVTGRADEAEDATREVRALLARARPADQVNALMHVVHMHAAISSYAALPGLLGELHAAAASAPTTAQLTAYAAVSYVLAMCGETSASSRATEQAQALLAESGWSLYRAELAAAQVLNAYNLGEWDTALSISRPIVAELEEVGSSGYISILRDVEAEILAHRGALREARQAATRRLPPHPTETVFNAMVLALIDSLEGDSAVARQRLERQLALHGQQPGVRAVLQSRLAEIDGESDPPAALRRLAAVDDYGLGQLDHRTFVISRICHGLATADVDAVREAVARADAHQLVFFQARARLALGELGIDARENLGDAVRTFSSLGARPWRARAAAELRRRDLPVPRMRAGNRRELTAIECQIARLVQRARPTREIALAVSLSVKRVENLLTQIYEKTGCSGRLALGRALDDGTLVLQDGLPAQPSAGAEH